MGRTWSPDLAASPSSRGRGDDLKSRFGWEPFRLAVGRRGLPRPTAVRPYRGLSVAYVPRGPVQAVTCNVDRTPSSTNSCAGALTSRGFWLGAGVLRSDGPKTPTLVRSLLRDAGFMTSEPIAPAAFVDPARSYAIGGRAAGGLSKGHRADIRRAERDGVTTRVDAPKRMPTFCTRCWCHASRKSFGFHNAAYYRAALAVRRHGPAAGRGARWPADRRFAGSRLGRAGHVSLGRLQRRRVSSIAPRTSSVA